MRQRFGRVLISPLGPVAAVLAERRQHVMTRRGKRVAGRLSEASGKLQLGVCANDAV